MIAFVSPAPNDLEDDDRQREEGEAFDERGGNDHRGPDVGFDLGLAGHAFEGTFGEHADPEGRASVTMPAPMAFKSEKGSAPRGPSCAYAVPWAINRKPPASTIDLINFI